MASHEGTSDNILKVIPIEILSKLCLMLKRERESLKIPFNAIKNLEPILAKLRYKNKGTMMIVGGW